MCSIDPPFCLCGHVFTENAIWHFSDFNNDTKSNFIYWTEKKVWWRSSGDFRTQKTCFFFQMAWTICMVSVCVNRKPHEMQNMFGCIWTFGQTIPSFRAWCSTNFQRSTLVHHQWGMTMLWLWKSLNKENFTKRSCALWKKNPVRLWRLKWEGHC